MTKDEWSAADRRAGSAPMYVRLRELLRSAIEHGAYEGQRLPTDVELTRRFGVSRHTVRHAMSALSAEGLIERVPGRGTFATGAHDAKYVRAFGTVSDLAQFARDTTLRVLEPIREIRNENVARRLALQDDQVALMVVMRIRHGHPLGVTDVYLAPNVAASLSSLPTTLDHHVTVVHLVEQSVGQPIVDADQDITAVNARGHVAQRLNVPEGAALLRIERLYHLANGRAVYLAISHYRPDRYTYRIELRGRPSR